MSEKQPEKHITLTDGKNHLPTPNLERQVRRVLRKIEKLARRTDRLASGEHPHEADG